MVPHLVLSIAHEPGFPGPDTVLDIGRTVLPCEPMVVQRWLKLWWHHKQRLLRNETLSNTQHTSGSSRGNSRRSRRGTCRTRSTRRTRNTTSRGRHRSRHVERVLPETHAGQGMGQLGRQHEQVNCCVLETVSVHPTWSTQSSDRSRHHSSERRKSIHNAKNTGVGAPLKAPPTDATTVGFAVNVLAVQTALALKRRGIVRFVCSGPHRGRATHPPPKTVCLKKCCLGCSNLGRPDLLNLHCLVLLLHLHSRRCGFLRGLLSNFRIALRRPSALFLGCLRLLRWIRWRV